MILCTEYFSSEIVGLTNPNICNSTFNQNVTMSQFKPRSGKTIETSFSTPLTHRHAASLKPASIALVAFPSPVLTRFEGDIVLNSIA